MKGSEMEGLWEELRTRVKAGKGTQRIENRREVSDIGLEEGGKQRGEITGIVLEKLLLTQGEREVYQVLISSQSII